MLHRVREIIEELKVVYEGSQGHGARCALDAVLRELDKIDPILGVWIEDRKIELFNPEGGATLVQWNNPTPGMLDVAHAVCTFYAEGPNGVRKLVKP